LDPIHNQAIMHAQQPLLQRGGSGDCTNPAERGPSEGLTRRASEGLGSRISRTAIESVVKE
jgi:hypothetical protein